MIQSDLIRLGWAEERESSWFHTLRRGLWGRRGGCRQDREGLVGPRASRSENRRPDRLGFSPPEVVCRWVGGRQLLSQVLEVLLTPHLSEEVRMPAGPPPGQVPSCSPSRPPPRPRRGSTPAPHCPPLPGELGRSSPCSESLPGASCGRPGACSGRECP